VTIGIIWAQAANGTIGRDGALPWRLPEDMAHFRRTTGHDAVVMGRRTWESLPERFRPLPGRRNIVLTRQSDWAAAGAETASDVSDAVRAAPNCWVIGGADIYAAALPLADRLLITELADDFDGDVSAPPIGTQWTRSTVDPAQGWSVSSTGLRYRIVQYARS
jgi:dihydrofolate reductase